MGRVGWAEGLAMVLVMALVVTWNVAFVSAVGCDVGCRPTCGVGCDVGCDVGWDVGCGFGSWWTWQMYAIREEAEGRRGGLSMWMPRHGMWLHGLARLLSPTGTWRCTNSLGEVVRMPLFGD